MKTYSDYLAYFTKAAENHKQLLHSDDNKRIYLIDLAELVNSMQSIANYPCIGLERTFWSSGGSFVNVRIRKTGGLMIFDRCNDPHDWARIEQCFNTCYNIAAEIQAKMVKDAKLYEDEAKDFLIPGLKIDTFTIEPMPMGYLDGGVYGVRLSFQFDEPADFFNPAKWTDDEPDYDI